MANYTCTTNMTLEACITAGPMNSGDDLTINNNATVTCDRTPSILIGNVNITYGKLHIDGANIGSGNMINFVGEYQQTFNAYGQGELDVDGAWYTLGTTDGSNSQTFSLATYYNSSFCVDVVPMVQVETGRRISFDNGSGTTPAVDDFVYKSTDRTVLGRIIEVQATYIVVKYLTGTLANNDEIQIRKIVDDKGPDLQKTWTADVNHASGDVLESGVYQEFGNSVVNGTSQLSAFNHGVGGFVFANVFQSATLTMGTAAGTTGGFVPPSGCNVRIPNVHFSTSNTTNYASNNTYQDGSNQEYNRYNLGTANAGKVNFNICNIGSSFFGCSSANEYKCYNVGATVAVGSTIAGTKTIFHNCCVCGDPLDVATNVPPFMLNDLPKGAEVKDCLSVTGACNHTMSINSSKDITVTGCIISDAGSGTNLQIRAPKISIIRCDGVTLANNIVINSNSSSTYPFMMVQTTYNLTSNMLIIGTQNETTQTNNMSGIAVNEFSKDILIKGVEVIATGTPGRWFFQFDDTINTKVRGVGMIDDPIDFGTYADEMAYMGGSCDNISFARCWKKNGGQKAFTNANIALNDMEFVNCASDYLAIWRPYGLDKIQYKGLSGGSNYPGSSTGIHYGYSGNYGYQFHDGFRSDTVGYIVCIHKAPSIDVDYVTITSGNPLFYNDGTLDMVSGDVIEIEQHYFVKGHISFPGTFTAVLNNWANWGVDEWPNVTVDFQYDIGSGWNGSWLNARTASNWTGITIVAATGIKLKYRYTATGTSANMNMFVLDTVTTIAHRKANFYTIDQVLVPVKVTVKKVSDMSLLPGAMVLLEAAAGGDLAVGTDILKGTTDAQGVIENTAFVYTANQPVVGRARLSSSTPFYSTSNISGTITDNGLELTAYMLLDE